MVWTLNKHTWSHNEYTGFCSQRHIQQLSKNMLNFIRSLLPNVLTTLTLTHRPTMTSYMLCCRENTLMNSCSLYTTQEACLSVTCKRSLSECELPVIVKKTEQLTHVPVCVGARLQRINNGDYDLSYYGCGSFICTA